jgi:peptide/nickel transport system ATP-binding protein
MKEMPPALSIRRLTVALPPGTDRAYAVRDISFDIQPGEVTCLIGESGSGKSVISQCVMGLLPATLPVRSGAVELRGEPLLAAGPARLRELRGRAMSVVFQEPMTALNPVMTCGAQVDEILAQHTRLAPAERRARILEIFERVRLPEPERIYSSYPHQLSGGQRQRIVIAIATILKPALLICDEPTTALDVTTQAEILRLIDAMRRETGTAVLFITHDFGVVADIADSVVVLRLGEQVEQGTREQVFGNPQHAYTRMLLAAVPPAVPPPRPARTFGDEVVRVENLDKTYAGGGWLLRRKPVAAVAGVSFRLRAGESLAIVGESGSGKSTVARCIARLHESSGGSISVGNHDYAKLDRRQERDLRRRVQIVFQDPYRSLNPRRRVGDSIVEGPTNFGVSAREAWKRAERLMEQVQLPVRALDRYPHEFSGGQRQRICIARALACEPDILIADEAVSALDVSVQAEILKLLEEIRSRQRLSLLFITHDLRVAGQVTDRVLVMHRGRVVEEGDVHTVLTRPTHAYTQALVQSLPGRHFQFGGAAAEV